MKVKKIVLALAAISLAPAAFAAAYTTSEITTARATGPSAFQETWLTGASATTQALYQEWAESCAAGTESVYTLNTVAGAPGSIGNYSAYVCNRGSKVSVLYHSIDNGSFTAYSPWLNGSDPTGAVMPTALKRLKAIGTDGVTLGREGLCATTSSFVRNGVTVPLYMGCTTVTGGALTANANPSLPGTAGAASDGAIARPAGGFSDVEVGLWGYTLPATIGTETNLKLLQTFGIAVSTKLYRALQVAQGIYANASAADADTTFDPAYAPNITSTQYASIIRLNGGYQQAWTKLAPTIALGTSNVNLQRRTELSGTQKSSNAYFLNVPCASAANQTLSAASANSGLKFKVSLNTSTGNVKKGLTTANGSATDPYAIGIMSLENNWRLETDPASSEYRFLKLDGVHPEAGDTTNARATTVSGAYTFAMEMRAFKAAGADTFGAALMDDLTTRLKTPTACTSASTARALSYDQAGSCTSTTDSSVLKSVITKGGKNCSKPTLY